MAGGLPLLLQDRVASYIYGPGGQILEQVQGTSAYYYHADQLGSVRALTSQGGAAVATYAYDAYGQPTVSMGGSMKQPQTKLLQDVVAHARQHLLAHPDHHLSPHLREAVYRAIGPFQQPAADAVRGWLGLITARSVLPQWERVWPHDPLAVQCLELAGDVLRGAVEPQLAGGQLSDLWERLETMDDSAAQSGLSGEPGYAAAWFAGTAAITSIVEAVGDHSFEAPRPWAQASDSDDDLFDSENGDVALWASRAYAGRVDGESASPRRRKEFWLWWLDEALPRSCQAVE